MQLHFWTVNFTPKIRKQWINQWEARPERRDNFLCWITLWNVFWNRKQFLSQLWGIVTVRMSVCALKENRKSLTSSKHLRKFFVLSCANPLVHFSENYIMPLRPGKAAGLGNVPDCNRGRACETCPCTFYNYGGYLPLGWRHIQHWFQILALRFLISVVISADVILHQPRNWKPQILEFTHHLDRADISLITRVSRIISRDSIPKFSMV